MYFDLSMFSTALLIEQLFPEKSLEEQQMLLERCEDSFDIFTEENWNAVRHEDIGTEEIQIKFLQTLYETQIDSDRGVVVMMMDSLLEWSKDQTILFFDLDEQSMAFYERWFCIAGFFHFDFIGPKKQEYLLRSRFLPLACVLDVPIYINVENHFANIAFIDVLKEDAATMALNMLANDTLLGDPKKMQKSISEWLKMFDAFQGSSLPKKVDEFLSNAMEPQRLDETDQKILSKILTLYWGLSAGFIWRDIKDTIVPGYARKEKKKSKTKDEYYLEFLDQADDMTQWLEDYESVAVWLDLSGKDATYVWRLLAILKEKIKLDDPHQVELCFSFFNELKSRGIEAVDEILYFDEQSNSFQWDDNFFIAPPEEEKTSAEVSAKKQDLGLAS